MSVDNIYCAFLRGINVGGVTMKMADLRDIFTKVGMEKVTTVLATGNIIFHSNTNQSQLTKLLNTTLSEYYHEEIHLFIKDISEIKAIIDNIPFNLSDSLHIYTFICESDFEITLLEEFIKITPTIDEKGAINANYFYWQVAIGATLTSGYSKILSRKTLKNHFTSRNINTIKKIYTKMSG